MSRRQKHLNDKNDSQIKKKGIKNFFSMLILVICIVLMFFSGKKILDWNRDNQTSQAEMEELAEVVSIDETKKIDQIERYEVDFDGILEKTSDAVGWLKVNGTNIEYPVVQGKDNDYYLNHSLNKLSNSAGWIFADYRNKLDGSDRNIIIYGHNRKDRSMFGSLRNVLTEDWYEKEENQKILFFTPTEKSVYQVFSVYKIEAESYYITTSFDNNSYETFLKAMKKRSIKDFGVELNSQDRILTLSTCHSNNQYRIVVHAKKLRENV